MLSEGGVTAVREDREVMPYKDPERKRRWEQAHRQQRTARRKAQRHASPSVASESLPTESPSSKREDKGRRRRHWTILLLAGAAIVAAVFLGCVGDSDRQSVAE